RAAARPAGLRAHRRGGRRPAADHVRHVQHGHRLLRRRLPGRRRGGAGCPDPRPGAAPRGRPRDPSPPPPRVDPRGWTAGPRRRVRGRARYRLSMDVRGYVEANAREFIDDLKQWLTIPSISADPDRHGDVRHSAAWLAGHLRRAGFPLAEVWDTGGLPAVHAEWPAADPAPPPVLASRHHPPH